MSLPFNGLTDSPLPAEFLAPLDEPYLPLEESVTGGTAIGDGAAGRQVKRWTVFYDTVDHAIKVVPEDGPVAFTLTGLLGVTSVSMGFDNNMQVSIAYQNAVGSNLYYFDSVLTTFTTLTIPGATSCRACVDDPRDFNNAASDVIFSYILDGVLYWRVQRERYATARVVGPAHGTLQRVGPNVHHRLQFLIGPL